MKLENVLNAERVSSLRIDNNAYSRTFKSQSKESVSTNSAEKVLFPQAYENAGQYYNKNEFAKPQPPEPPQNHNHHQNSCGAKNSSMFDIKSILPMLMSGKFNDLINPFMSMLGGVGKGGGGMDFAKIFELFKPKSKPKKEEKNEEEISSKFDDFVIIED